MNLSIEIDGLDQLDTALDGLIDPAALREAVAEAALLVENDAKLSIMHGSPSGHEYKHGKVHHVASAPGQPPATDTGILASSIHTTFSDDGLTAIVGSPLDIATYLEYGTSHMAARPFIEPALDKNRGEIVELIAGAVGEAA